MALDLAATLKSDDRPYLHLGDPTKFWHSKCWWCNTLWHADTEEEVTRYLSEHQARGCAEKRAYDRAHGLFRPR